MPHVSCSQPVEADIQTIWRVFMDKIENPDRYMAYVKETRFLEDADDYVVREICTEDMSLQERITLDERLGEVRFQLLNHPLFSGEVLHQIVPPALEASGENIPSAVVKVTMDWTPKNEEAKAVERTARADIEQSIEEATLYIKRMAEQLERQKHLQG
ncbi:MAG: AtaL-like protein [Vampirovibrionales bacterium]|nr:AtaL-like protein [Vampirovibrionales bacterium]